MNNEPTAVPALCGPERRTVRLRAAAVMGVFCLSSLLLCMGVPPVVGWIPATWKGWIPAAIGLGVALAAIPLHAVASSSAVLGRRGLKSLLYGLSILVNTVGTTLSASAYAAHTGQNVSAVPMFSAVALPCLLALVLVVLLLLLPAKQSLVSGIHALVTLFLCIGAVVCWIINDNKLFFSFLFFHLLNLLIAEICLHCACEETESPWLRFSSFGSFGLLLIVGAVVLLILLIACGGDGCDCDCGDGCCEGCDCGPSEGRKKSRRG